MLRKIFTSFVFVLVFTVASAQDLGVGNNVSSTGRSGSEQIKDFFKQKIDDGSFPKKQEAWRQKQIDYLKNPPDLKVPTDLSYSAKKYELIYTASIASPLLTSQSPLKNGEKIKPLEHIDNVRLLPAMIFINANDNRQLKYALDYRKKLPTTKIVITAGPWLELTNKYNPIFYDQRRALLDSFNSNYQINLSSVPLAISFTDDKKMMVVKGLPEGY